MRNCIEARKFAGIRRNKKISANIKCYFLFSLGNYSKHVAYYKPLFVYFILYIDLPNYFHASTILSILRIYDLMAIKNIKDYNRMVVLLQVD